MQPLQPRLEHDRGDMDWVYNVTVRPIYLMLRLIWNWIIPQADWLFAGLYQCVYWWLKWVGSYIEIPLEEYFEYLTAVAQMFGVMAGFLLKHICHIPVLASAITLTVTAGFVACTIRLAVLIKGHFWMGGV